eukprot:7624913-Pyramimonas_sp.AAC.1
MCGGALSGKYVGGDKPADSRFAKYPNFMVRYQSDASTAAINKYQKIADEAGISLATLSLAWCRSR